MKKDLSLYIHYPFCLKKCHYCDFVSMAGDKAKGLSEAYEKSITNHKDIFDSHQIKTLFFGGGTPSLMDEKLLGFIFNKLDLSKCEEISIEVNPATADENKIKFFRDIGFNRISIGIQSLIDKDLKVLGRIHSKKNALEMIEIAKKYFDNVSADFIYARPNQTAKSWEKELGEILDLDLQHISMYQLTIENDWDVDLPDDEECEKMFVLNHEMASPYNHYEISNYAKPGYESKHNLAYWMYQNYLGLGASAHSRIDGVAMIYDQNIMDWIKNPTFSTEYLSEQQIFTEKLLMGLRLAKGIDLLPSDFDFINKTQLDSFINQGLIVKNNNTIAPSFNGMMLCNYIIDGLLG